MSGDDSERRILTRKELAREQRREAYQRAKEQRAKDPRYLAMKEAAKEQRREAYRKAKERRKAAEAEEKKKQKALHAKQVAQRMDGAAQAMLQLLKGGRQVAEAQPQARQPGRGARESGSQEGEPEERRVTELEPTVRPPETPSELSETLSETDLRQSSPVAWLSKGSDAEN